MNLVGNMSSVDFIQSKEGRRVCSQLHFSHFYFPAVKSAKIEEAKVKYQKSAGRLHRIHNDYVMSLREVSSCQEGYLTRTLPSFLNYHQTSQEILVQQW